MFPIRDHNPSDRTPYVTYALMAANILVFLGYFELFNNETALRAFFDTYGLVPAKVMATGDLLGFLTSMFLHGEIAHLGGNMLFLWIFGDNVEDKLGHLGFLLFYLASGLIAAAGQFYADPGSTVPMVGASGAIAGVLGGYLLLFPKAKVDVVFIIVVIARVLPVPAVLMLGLWFGMQIFGGLAATGTGGGVAYWAHAGGFLAGLAMMGPVWLSLGGTGFWTRTEGHPDHPEASYKIGNTTIPVVKRRR